MASCSGVAVLQPPLAPIATSTVAIRNAKSERMRPYLQPDVFLNMSGKVCAK